MKMVLTGERAVVVDTQIKVIAAALKRAREARGLTQRQVADELGIGQGTVSFIETGRSVPSLMAVLAMADLYEMPLTLWEGSDGQVG